MPTRRIVGCMTGTSIDALDAALVEITGGGLSMTARVVRTASRPLGELAGRVRALASQTPTTAGQIARLSLDFSRFHVDVIRELLVGTHADLIAVHGQTVFHEPPASWQLLTPTVIAHALNAPVVFDLRAADLAAGGQGAPITPIADFVLFRHESERRAIINLGGFCNFTLLPASGPNREARNSSPLQGGVGRGSALDAAGRLDALRDIRGSLEHASLKRGSLERESLLVPDSAGIPSGKPTPRPVPTFPPSHVLASIRGGDICACNHLLDQIARTRLKRPFDGGGAIAQSGRTVAGPLSRLIEILEAQSAAGRSLGTGDELAAWVADQRDLSPADVARTACDAIGHTVAARIALHAPIDRLVLAGGGVRNACLYDAIATAAKTHSIAHAGMDATDDFGVPAAFREAAAMAILGALCQDRVPITLRAITGAPNPPISGSWVHP